MNVLELVGLTVGYRTHRRVRTVLTGLDATLEAGGLVGLVGPNGAGKSTLLRTISGLQPPLAGSVKLLGQEISRMKRDEVARQVAVVLTDRVDPGRLTVFDVVALGRHPHTGWSGRLGATDCAAVMSALDDVGVGQLAGQMLWELSDGQRQRVMIARAIAQEPRLLLLDEPLSALDRALREQLATDVRAILREGGTTALYVTHDQDEAMTVADRVGVMESGRLLRLDTPQRLWTDPGSSKVARFLGFDVVGDLALAPGALRVVGGDVGQSEERGGPAETWLSATVLASRLRRGQWEAEVELAPEQLVELTKETGVGTDATVDRVPARATALAQRPHDAGERVPLRLDPARTARL